jgi:hypothetical protein
MEIRPYRLPRAEENAMKKKRTITRLIVAVAVALGMRVVCPDATNIAADLLEEGYLPLDLARDRVDHRIFY